MDLIDIAKVSKLVGAPSWNELTDKPFDSVVTEGMKSVTLKATDADGGWGADIDLATAIINDPSCATAIVRGQEYKLGTYNWPYSPHPSERRYTLEGLGYGYIHFKVGDPNIGYGDMMGVNSVELKAYCVSETVTRLDEKFMPLLTSPNGTKFRLYITDDGFLTAIEV